MRWDEIDMVTLDWAIPGNRTKSKREHVVPLSLQVMEILGRLPRKSVVVAGKTRPSPFVFTTDGTHPISGFSKAQEGSRPHGGRCLQAVRIGSDSAVASPRPPTHLRDRHGADCA